MGCSHSQSLRAADVAEIAVAVKKHFGDDATGPECDHVRKQLVGCVEEVNSADRDGVSLLDVQRGLFNLLQAGAYRTFRFAYAADYHTHKRDHAYPYLLSNYVAFTGVMMDLYKVLRVVDAKHNPKMDALHSLLVKLEATIREQIAAWTDADEAAFEAKMAAIADKEPPPPPPKGASLPGFFDDRWRWGGQERSPMPLYSRTNAAFEEGVRCSLSIRALCHACALLTQIWAMRCTQFDDDYTGDFSHYLLHYNRVLLDYSEDWQANEKRGGANAPVAFWYEQFMPLLLEVCSLGVEGYAAADADDAQLDAWMSEMKSARNFERFGSDVVEGWAECSAQTKLSIKRAWRLCRHYFLGPQKERERSSESGADHRQTGDLSQYVAFLDVYLKRSYVEKAGMRLTFPYWVGPSTWIWHHFLGERAHEFAAKGAGGAAKDLVDAFGRYVSVFVTMYPCPYCRHHLNAYVIRNVEKDLYPVEYILLGWSPSADDTKGITTPALKLSYVTDATTMRLFIWKLHNAVSSSIERSEEWYKATDSVNTSRYWPNMYSTLYRAATHSGCVSAERVHLILDVVDSAVKLNLLRASVLALQPEQADELLATARPLIAELDHAILSSGFLTETYGWSGRIDDKPPDVDFATKHTAFTRDQHFTLA